MTTKTKGHRGDCRAAQKITVCGNSSGIAQTAVAAVCTLAVWGLIPVNLADRLVRALGGGHR